jgi:hypothetical protein
MTILGQALDFEAAPVFGLWLIFPGLVVVAIAFNRWLGRGDG